MKRKNTFTRLVQLTSVFLIMGVAVSITLIDVIGSYRDFQKDSESIRADFLLTQKKNIKRQVLQVVDLINYQKEQTERFIRERLKSRVLEAYSIVENIYEENKATKDKDEILKMVVDALRPIRFDNGSGYYFAIRMDGMGIFFADRPEMDWTDILNLQESRGQYLVRDSIAIAKKYGVGFYEYHWSKPNREGVDFKKISYLKVFEPFNCFFGAGMYVDDMTEEIKKNLIPTISQIRFGKEGYIFLGTVDGDLLISNGKVIQHPGKLWEVYEDQSEKMKVLFGQLKNAALKPGGGYAYYSFIKISNPTVQSPKVSFLYYIPEFRWIIGAGFYIDDIEKSITRSQAELNKQVRKKILYFSAFSLVILGFFLLLFGRLNLKLSKDINVLIAFFKQAASLDEPIDRNRVHFEEFNRMAVSANRMLEDKIQAQQELIDEKEALRISETKFRSLVESSYDWIWEVNTDFVFTYSSPQVEIILGYRPEEVIGRSLFDFMPIAEVNRLKRMLPELLQEKKPIVTLENIVLHKNGSPVSLETNGVLFFDESGEVAGYRGVDRDITERIRAAEVKEKLNEELNRAKRMESIGLLAGGVAHDLNNILSGIVGYPDLMLRNLPADSELRKPIKAIQDSGHRAAAVVADLLTVARNAASNREPHHLNTIIDEYLVSPEHKKLQTLFPEVKCLPQLTEEQSCILCSPVHIKKCLMNLVANGYEAIINSGTVFITTRLQHVDDSAAERYNVKPGEYVVLIIRDTGPGIIKEDLLRIFEPFYSRKIMGRRSGSGLGLTVVWNTMEAHEGAVLVDSNEKGTCFSLYFPACRKKQANMLETGEPVELNGQGKRILVVDDEPLLQDIASQMLESMNFEVDVAASGEDAVVFVQTNAVDLIVIDMLMEPGMNGRQTYEQIIRLKPGQRAIVASGFSESDDVKATLKMGAAGFIRKPYSTEQLSQAIQQALET
jgi:PAS domain S-box-containing protein